MPMRFSWEKLSENLEGSSHFSKYQTVFFSSLINFGKEFEQVGKLQAAECVYKTLDKSLGKRKEVVQKTQPKETLFFETARKSIASHCLQETQEFFNQHKDLIPESENAYYKIELAHVKDCLGLSSDGRNKSDELSGPIGTINNNTEVLRDLRDQICTMVIKYKKALENHGAANVNESFPETTGFYNALYNVKMVMKMVGDADPLWVEDIKEQYSELLKLKMLFKIK